MDAHDQAAHAQHVVGVGEADEAHRGHVVDEHDQEVLRTKQGDKCTSMCIHAYVWLCATHHLSHMSIYACMYAYMDHTVVLTPLICRLCLHSFTVLG